MLHWSDTYKEWRKLHPEVKSESYSHKLYYKLKKAWKPLKNMPDFEKREIVENSEKQPKKEAKRGEKSPVIRKPVRKR